MTSKTDYTKYDYTKIAPFSNVSAEIEKGTASTIIFDDFMRPLIEKVALGNPQWELIAYGMNTDYSTGAKIARRFRVFEGNEYIGSLSKDGYGGNYKFEMDNDRIRNARYRRGGICTKDLKKAYKTVKEHFVAPSTAEVRLRAVQAVNGMVNNEGWSQQRHLDSFFDKYNNILRRYVLENMETARSTLVAYGIPDVVLDDFCEKFPGVMVAQSMSDTHSKGRKGTVVLVTDDGNYSLHHPSNPDPFAVLTANELSPDVKAKLGVLKIVPEAGTPIESIGMKINDTTFYLLPQE